MGVIELLIYIVRKFLRLKPDSIDQIELDAKNWETDHVARETKIGAIIIKSRMWYVKLGLALLCLFLVKSIGDWFYNSPDADLDDDDDDDDDQPQKRKKIKLF